MATLTSWLSLVFWPEERLVFGRARRQNHEQTSGQCMTHSASKQGGLGLQNDSPIISRVLERRSTTTEYLVAPFRAILRYYRCDTPYRAILPQPSQQSPNRVRYPPLVPFFYTDISVRYPILQHIARYLCDTPGKQAR